MKSATKNEIKEAFVFLVIGTLSAVGSSFAVNSFLTKLTPAWRSGAQIAVGAVPLIFFGSRHRYIRYAGAGSALAGTLGLTQKVTSMQALAGNGALSPEEIRMLQSAGALPQLSGPVTFRNMNGPTTFRNMGQQPSMMGSSFRVPS